MQNKIFSAFKSVVPLTGSKKPLLFVVLLALVLRFALFLAVQPWNQESLKSKIMQGDSSDYHRLAVDIYNFGTYSSATSQFRTPGYPLFLASIYSLVGIKPWIALIFQIFVSLCTMLLLYMCTQFLFNNKVSVIAAFLYALDPLSIYYSNSILSETLFSFIFLASAIGLVFSLKTTDIRWVGISGLLLSIATLIRPVTQFFPLIAVGAIALWVKADKSFRVNAALLFVTFSCIGIVFWAVRNEIKYGHFGLTSFSGYNLLIENATATEKYKTGKSYTQIRKEFRDVAEARGVKGGGQTFEDSTIYGEIAKKYLLNNLFYYIPLHLRGMLIVFLDVGVIGICKYLGIENIPLTAEFTPSYKGLLSMTRAFFRIKPFDEIIISMIFYIQLFLIYGAFIYGSILMIREQKSDILIYFIFIFLYFSFLPGVIGRARYRVPVFPFMLMVSARGIFEFLCRLIHKFDRRYSVRAIS